MARRRRSQKLEMASTVTYRAIEDQDHSIRINYYLPGSGIGNGRYEQVVVASESR